MTSSSVHVPKGVTFPAQRNRSPAARTQHRAVARGRQRFMRTAGAPACGSLARLHAAHGQDDAPCRVGSSVRDEHIPARHGHIRVTVAATGNGLKACDLSLLHGVRNSSDPYLVFSQEGSELGRTETVVKNLNPVWRPLKLRLSPHCAVHVACFDSDDYSADDLIGQAEVSVQQLLAAELDTELELLDEHHERAGSIRLKTVNMARNQTQFLSQLLAGRGAVLKTSRVRKRVSEREVAWLTRTLTLHENALTISPPQPPGKAHVQRAPYGLCRTEEEHAVLDIIPICDVHQVRKVTLNRTEMQEFVDLKEECETVENVSSNMIQRRISKERSLRRMPSARRENAAPSTSSVHFCIETVLDGFNEGRSYFFESDTDAREEWINAIRAARKKKISELAQQLQPIQKYRAAARKLYASAPVNNFFMALIMLNFAAGLAESEVRPEPGSQLLVMFQVFDYCFVTAFTIELVINLFGTWRKDFVEDKWNIFDTFIVVMSLAAYPLQGVPGLSNVKIIRVLRVVRLFRRVESMRLIISALGAAIIPVSSAFFLMFLFTSIYAVLAVELFSHKDARYFGNFSASFFTMFQILSGDEWSTVCREMFAGGFDGEIDREVAFFFCSYVVGCGIILMNSVIAVLLDEFIKSVEREKSEGDSSASQESRGQRLEKGVLDPLLQCLTTLNSVDEQLDRIGLIFENFSALAQLERSQRMKQDNKEMKTSISTHDADGVGTKVLSYDDILDGFSQLRLPQGRCIYMSREDFHLLTHRGEEGQLCDQAGRLSKAHFELMVMEQLRLFLLRRVNNSLLSFDNENDQNVDAVGAVLHVVKHLVHTTNELKQNQLAASRGAADPRGDEKGEIRELASVHARLDAIMLQLATIKGGSEISREDGNAEGGMQDITSTGVSGSAQTHSAVPSPSRGTRVLPVPSTDMLDSSKLSAADTPARRLFGERDGRLDTHGRIYSQLGRVAGEKTSVWPHVHEDDEADASSFQGPGSCHERPAQPGMASVRLTQPLISHETATTLPAAASISREIYRPHQSFQTLRKVDSYKSRSSQNPPEPELADSSHEKRHKAALDAEEWGPTQSSDHEDDDFDLTALQQCHSGNTSPSPWGLALEPCASIGDDSKSPRFKDCLRPIDVAGGVIPDAASRGLAAANERQFVVTDRTRPSSYVDSKANFFEALARGVRSREAPVSEDAPRRPPNEMCHDDRFGGREALKAEVARLREALEAAGSDLLELEGAAPAAPAKTNARRTPAVSAVPNALPDAGLKPPQSSQEPEARRARPNDMQTLRLM